MQVNVRSTDMDRTLMSASAMLSALYPPDNSQVSNFNYIVSPENVTLFFSEVQ